ncbi:MAG TPA: DUF2239 family protein [Gemmatimonadaceae bacterium]|nr:DUF2239 family protein [Gemmatimonadaceae bacterium]
MGETVTPICTAFAGTRRLASGTLADVAVAARRALDAGSQEPILIFDDETARVVDVDLRGTPGDVAERYGATRRGEGEGEGEGSNASSPYRETLTPRGRGRPKLGVVAREVTLLPRHWEWLASQPGGASAAVRRLVDAARQTSADRDRSRAAKEVAYRFMSAMAGNEPGFEEATRALFANNAARFAEMTASWPRDVRDYARRLAERAL